MMRRMPYAILRVAKLKTIGNIAGSANHAFRETETPNADSKRLSQNKLAGPTTTAELLASVKSKLPEKRRKDAVLALEYFVGASPEAFAEDWQKTKAYKKAYFADALEWLKKRHGEENLVAAQIHLDEQSPHMSVFIVPRTSEGKLSAKQFIGGRVVLSRMQSDFARDVGAKHGLERGVEGSKATHTTRKEYYSALSANPDLKPPKPPKKTLFPNLKELNKYSAALSEFSQVVAQTAAIALLDKRDKDALAKQAGDLAIEVRNLREQLAEVDAVKSENRRLNTNHVELMDALDNQNSNVIDLKRHVLMVEHQLKEKTAEVEALKRPTRAPSKTSGNSFRP
jgi:hypothetical protein